MQPFYLHSKWSRILCMQGPVFSPKIKSEALQTLWPLQMLNHYILVRNFTFSDVRDIIKKTSFSRKKIFHTPYLRLKCISMC